MVPPSILALAAAPARYYSARLVSGSRGPPPPRNLSITYRVLPSSTRQSFTVSPSLNKLPWNVAYSSSSNCFSFPRTFDLTHFIVHLDELHWLNSSVMKTLILAVSCLHLFATPPLDPDPRISGLAFATPSSEPDPRIRGLAFSPADVCPCVTSSTAETSCCTRNWRLRHHWHVGELVSVSLLCPCCMFAYR